jgi:DegV family protein with EDD domain
MVKLITDSIADLPPEVVKDLGITVIPMYVHFGTDTYKDKVDLTAEEFYHKLETTSVLPKTSAPSPGLFAKVFDEVAESCDEILAIFISRKFSATYDAALQGMSLMKRKCRIEVIDSKLAIMGQGLLVIEAAKKALAGASLNELLDMVSETIPKIHVRVSFDTLKYLAMGGRVANIQALMGSILKMNPVLGIKNGEAFPFARVRSRTKSIEWLYKFTTSCQKVKALAVEYGTDTAEGRALAKRITSVFPGIPIYISNISPVIGTHTGPGAISITVLEE